MTKKKTIDSPLPDQGEREAASRDQGVDMLVEAGAGTGKTSTLVARIIDIIGRGIAPIQKIAAITFTEKAAGEMVTRLRDSMNKTVKKMGISGEKLNLEQSLKNFEYNNVKTIHSFARSIIAMFPFESQVAPGFAIMDEKDEKTMIDGLWDDWVRKTVEQPGNPLESVYSIGLNNTFLKEYFSFLYNNRDFFETYSFDRGDDLQVHEEKLKHLADEIYEFGVVNCGDTGDKGFLQIVAIKEAYESLDRSNSIKRIKQMMSWMIKNKKYGSSRAWGDKKEEKIELMEEIDGAIDACVHSVCRRIFMECAEEMKHLTLEIENKKISQGVLTFQDILIKARNLLRDNRRVREYFKTLYYRILVDEFQDTDPLQAEIVFFLAEEPGDFSLEWDKCRIVPGKLFFVGDPKQSIYRFRRADIEIYEKVKEIINTTGAIAEIKVNFRTLSPIIQWVNLQFSRAIKPPSDGGSYQPEYKPLIPYREESCQPSVFIIKGDEDKDEDKEFLSNTENVCLAEAWAVADFLRDRVEGQKLKIWDRSGESRPAGYGDIALLFPQYNHIKKYEEAFESRQIPFLLDKGRFFYQRDEIRDVLSLLKAIDNPKNEVAVAAEERAPFTGLSDEDLFFMVDGGVPFDYMAADETPHPASHIYKVLQDFHGQRNSLSVKNLMDRVLKAFYIREFYTAAFPDERRPANLQKLLNLAHAFDWEKGGTLNGFIRSIQESMDDKARESDTPLAEPGTDAVRMMTFHGSKGLEFPVVVMAFLGSKKRNMSNNFILDRTKNDFVLGKKMDSNKKIRDFKFPRYDLYDDLEDRRELAEKVRLLYVAATRARDVLVIPSFSEFSFTQSGGWKRVSSIYSDILVDTIPEPCQEMAELVETVCVERKFIRYAGVKKMVNYEMVGEPVLECFTTDLGKWRDSLNEALEMGRVHEKWVSYSREKSVDNDERVDDGDTPEMRIGRVYHAVMERVDYKGMKPGKKMAELLCKREGIPQHLDDILVMVEGTLKSDLIKRARQAVHMWKEYPFEVEFQGNLYRGVMDLLLKEGESYTIVDFKTDNIREDQLKERARLYIPQARIYRNAVETLTGSKVNQVLLYFARIHKIHSVVL